ncbi:MAG: hypothetical protein P9M14_10405 [Candidatus Alcyoniella australis]|nr:hypothetical protein [Candidatus Alcyoniella australis]
MTRNSYPVLLAVVILTVALPAFGFAADKFPETFVEWACNVVIVRGETELMPTDLNYPRYLEQGDVLRIPADQDRCKLGMSKVRPGMMLEVKGLGRVMFQAPIKTAAQATVGMRESCLLLSPDKMIAVWTDCSNGGMLIAAGRALVRCQGTVKVEHTGAGVEIWVTRGSAQVTIDSTGDPINVGFSQALIVPDQGEVAGPDSLPLGAKAPMELRR